MLAIFIFTVTAIAASSSRFRLVPTGARNGEGWCEVGCGWGRWGRRVRQSQNLPWTGGVGSLWTCLVLRGGVGPWYTCYVFGLG